MSAEYREILKLRVRHGFYQSGVCKDFRIVPIGETSLKLQNYRLHLRDEGSEIKVFAETRDGSTPLIELDDLSQLQFGLILQNTTFSLFTDLPDTKTGHRQALKAGQQLDRLWISRLPNYFFHKSTDSNTLQQMDIFEAFEFLPVRLKTTQLDRDVTVTLRTENGDTVAEQTFRAIVGATAETKLNGWVEDTLDIRSLAGGLYKLSTNISGQPVINIMVRSDLNSKFFRTVWLSFSEDAFVQDDGSLKPTQIFDVTFNAASNAWAYNIKVGKKRASKKFKITHVPDEGETAIEFHDAEESPVTGGERSLLIRSKLPIPYSDTPRKAIKLLQVPDPPVAADGGPAPAAEPIIENLPNPSPGEAKAEIFISI